MNALSYIYTFSDWSHRSAILPCWENICIFIFPCCNALLVINFSKIRNIPKLCANFGKKSFPVKDGNSKKIRKINFQVVPSQDFNWLLGNPVRVYTPLDQAIALENWNLLFFIYFKKWKKTKKKQKTIKNKQTNKQKKKQTSKET